jgi:hypothetical protein
MRCLVLIFSFCSVCLALSADELLQPLAVSDGVSDTQVNTFKSTQQVLSLEKAFEVEAIGILALEYELETPNELEILKREHALLKIRLAALERRVAAVEAQLLD